MVNVNSFKGLCDNEIIENAINARGNDGIVIIPPREADCEPERDYWLLDRAVLLPENTTVILQNCKIKLSDRCRDNFFRTANCGMGIDFPERISNIHIKGVGHCVLEGADHPRATGDGSKLLANPCPYKKEDLCRLGYWIPEERRKSGELVFWDYHDHSCGTDADKPDESHYGDWRGIGILFANAENISVENVHIAYSHGWGISLEECAHGRLEKISFNACMSREIDGMLQNMENQDGIDIRNGCHDIIITDITGHTGDDLIALTAIADDSGEFCSGGSLRNTHVMHNDWTRRERDIHDIIIRNVVGYSHLCFLIRLLPAGCKIYNIVIDGVVDTTPAELSTGAGLFLGDLNGYGVNLKESMSGISISNVVCKRPSAVQIDGYLVNSVITNVTNLKPDCHAVCVAREGGAENVRFSSITALNSEPIIYQNQKI